MDNIYIKFERKENEKYRKKNFCFNNSSFSNICWNFCNFFRFQRKKQKEKNEQQQAEKVCKNEKIVKKTLMEAIYYRTGFDYYKPVIILENGKVLEVNKEQFDKAVEGNECRTIFH